MNSRTLVLPCAVAFCTAATPLPAQTLPADNTGAHDRLEASPRHGEWVRYAAGGNDSVNAWVVYPERADKAPVIVVIHEIFGLTDWVRGVADQLAAEGFIAIAPDLLTGKAPGGGGSEVLDRQGAVRLIRALDPHEVSRRLRTAAEYAMALPAARRKVASIGFCWGGSTSFRFATEYSELSGAVVYYGTAPGAADLERINAPVLGNYGGDDARVTATVAPTGELMDRLHKRFEPQIYPGAGHGFLRQQSGRNGANLVASKRAWSRTVNFLKEVLSSD